MNELSSHYQKLFFDGKISRKTFRWRIRGLGILNELYKTSSFEWKVFITKNESLLSRYCKEILTRFLSSLGDISRIGIYRSITERYFLFLTTHGHHTVKGVLPAIFTEADCLKRNKNTPNRHLIVPALLRLIYFCGLRPNEGREIKKSDVDLDSGTLFIRKNKTHRERIVPMSDDIRNFCIDYNEKLKIFSPKSEYFFPNPDGIPYSAKWLTRQFLSIWERIQPVQCSTRVRVYDLRHRFASTVMMNWLNEGVDLYAKLPYLSTYMGHARFSDTAYYIHLLPTNLTRSNAIDWDSFLALIPEVSPW